MATITAYKTISPEGPWTWTDKFDFETGPTTNLESENLNDLPQILKPIWDKGWGWVLIEASTYTIKIYSSGICNYKFKK